VADAVIKAASSAEGKVSGTLPRRMTSRIQCIDSVTRYVAAIVPRTPEKSVIHTLSVIVPSHPEVEKVILDVACCSSALNCAIAMTTTVASVELRARLPDIEVRYETVTLNGIPRTTHLYICHNVLLVSSFCSALTLHRCNVQHNATFRYASIKQNENQLSTEFTAVSGCVRPADGVCQGTLSDFSVVLFRSDFVLVSEKNRMKCIKNQWLWIMQQPPEHLSGGHQQRTNHGEQLPENLSRKGFVPIIG
jgi:hypothetical protein